MTGTPVRNLVKPSRASDIAATRSSMDSTNVWRHPRHSQLESCKAVHQPICLSARWWSFLNSTLQGIPYMLNNVHVWSFRWQKEVLKVRRVLLEPFSSNTRRAGCRFGCWIGPSPSECTIDMNWRRWTEKILTFPSLVRVVSFMHVAGIPYHIHFTRLILWQKLYQIEQYLVHIQST